MYKVYKGVKYRVKFSVIELPNKVMFGVEVLDTKYNKNTKFSLVGKIKYYGTDFWEAWSIVQSYVFNAVIPKKFGKYIVQ